MPNRRGFTLIETLVVISTMSVILMLSATTIFFLMRAEGDGTRALTSSTSFARLQNAFRRDARAASSAHINQTGAGEEFLEFEFNSSQSIQYRIVGDQIVRNKFVDETVSATEEFFVPKTTIGFEVAQQNGKTVAVLSCDRRPLSTVETKQKTVRSREYRIVAAIGRDRRFEKDLQ